MFWNTSFCTIAFVQQYWYFQEYVNEIDTGLVLLFIYLFLFIT
jgi:hypothetical protein